MVHRISIEPLAFLAAAAAVLVLPLEWLLSACIAAAFHEMCHYFAVRAAGQRVHRLTIRPFGAEMSVSDIGRGEELICAAAGPLGSIALLLFVRWFPKIAICGLVQGLFNLLPVYPLDGGRMLRCLASEKICQNVQRTILAALILIGIWMVKYTVAPLLMLAVVCIRLLARKIPCKDGR